MDELPDFEAWWNSEGQYSRAGGGQYEKTFAYNAWRAAVARERERCAKVCDDAASRLFAGKSRVNQVDRHVAQVLTDKAAAIRKGE